MRSKVCNKLVCWDIWNGEMVDPHYIHRFHIYEFAYLLKFICNIQINTHSAFAVIHGHSQSYEKFSHPTCTLSAQVKQAGALPLSFIACTIDECFFFFFFLCVCVCGLFSAHFTNRKLVILLLRMLPKYNTDILSSVLRHKKSVVCLTERTRLLYKLLSRMNYSATGRELDFNDLMICIK